MRRSTAILGLISFGLAVASIYLWRELDQERTRTAEFRDRPAIATMPSTPVVASLHVNTSTPPAAAVAPSKPPATIAPTSPATPVNTANAVNSQEAWNARQRQLMQDPRYREVQFEQGRLTYARRRENLIRLLGLSPEQADAVIDLQLERQFQQEEMAANPAADELAFRQHQLDQAREKENQAKLRELLGDTRYAQLNQYMESRQSRMQVDSFRNQLSSADALRDDQVEPLIEALHVERTRMQEELEQYSNSLVRDGRMNESPFFTERHYERIKAMHAGMRSSATAILSSSQLKQLDSMLNRELRRHEANMRMSKIQSKLDSAGGVAPQSN
jgi:hypothetical protein